MKIGTDRKNNEEIAPSEAVTYGEGSVNVSCAIKKLVSPTIIEKTDIGFTRIPKIKMETVVPAKKRKWIPDSLLKKYVKTMPKQVQSARL